MARRGSTTSSSSRSGKRGAKPHTSAKSSTAQPPGADDNGGDLSKPEKLVEAPVAMMEAPEPLPPHLLPSDVTGPGPDAPATDSTSMKFPAEADLGERLVEYERHEEVNGEFADQESSSQATQVLAQLEDADVSMPSEPTVEAAAQPPLLFEVAWEVCWQLGGIYTVLKTKAAAMLEKWGDRYCLIGPYNPHTAPMEFEEQPTYGSIRDTLQRLQDSGLKCHFGRWLVPGRPRVILIDHRGRYPHLAEDKYLMWNDHHISTVASDGEVNDVIAFGFAVTEFFRRFTEVVQDRPILAHFHEWMGGVAVPRIAHLRIKVSTIFTTHATLLGRYIAGDNPNFYNELPGLDPDALAAKYQIYPKFAIERAAAHASTVFTTVSDVTSLEAEKLLGRKPDAILPNGLNIQRFAAPHEFQYLHSEYKQQIHDFVMGHFFPSYTFDLDRTLYLFTAGRYEYTNKGFDLYIEALYRLNQRMKEMLDPPTIVAFIVTRAQTKNINVQVLQNQSMFDELRNTCNDIQAQMGRRLFQSAATGRLPGYQELMPEDAQVRLKRALHAWRKTYQPLIVTHDLADDVNDPVLKHLRHRGLLNGPNDPVKVIFHPEFVTATSPTISLDYEQFVRGCHVGIFPSYYEPWGYTPMECIALGVPAVTTDLSGFGAYVESHLAEKEGGRRRSDDAGMLVLKRRQRGFEDTVEALVHYLMQFAQLNRRQRIELRNRVERQGENFDWSVLVRHYDEAHNMALERTGAKRLGVVDVRVV
jgi:glycogen(starch) synthase